MRHARTTSLFVSTVLAAGLVACGGGGTDAGQGTDDADPGSTAGTNEDGEPDDEHLAEAESLVAEVVGADGTEHGRVTFTEADGGVLVEAVLQGFDGAGFHGFHLHEEGQCDAEAPDGPFDSAGGHLGVDGSEHGGHPGDLTALQVSDDGRAVLTVRTTALTFEELADANAAVIVHADPDNFGNIPPRYAAEDTEETGPDEETLDTGDAGDRLACGVVVAPQGE